MLVNNSRYLQEVVKRGAFKFLPVPVTSSQTLLCVSSTQSNTKSRLTTAVPKESKNMSQCFLGHTLNEIGKGTYERAERLHSKLLQDIHAFQRTQNTGIFQGKLIEVKAITNDMMVFPFKLLLPKLLNIL